MPRSRSFARASLDGNPVGRPPGTGADQPSRTARGLIAARRYLTAMRSRGLGGDDPGANRSISTGGDISMYRGDARRQLADLMRAGAED